MQKKVEQQQDCHLVTYQGLYGSNQQDPPFFVCAICWWEAKLCDFFL